jgi:hypothetical protein
LWIRRRGASIPKQINIEPYDDIRVLPITHDYRVRRGDKTVSPITRIDTRR